MVEYGHQESDWFPVSLSYRPDLADSWYSLSYLYLAVFGMLVTIVSGLLVSIATGESSSIAFAS